MSKLKIIVNKEHKDTVARTIRVSGETFDRIMKLAETNGIKFNNVVNQLLEYALDNVEE